MKKGRCAGLTLVELLVAMTISALVGSMILQMMIGFQSRILAEVSRNNLQDRAERLMRFMANDIRDAGFLLGPVPQVADGTPLALVHDSLAGDPLESVPFSIIAKDNAGGDDRLTCTKAVSFAPPLFLAQPAAAGGSEVLLTRRPNRSPGSSRELQPSPEAINHLVLANRRSCYSVQFVDLALNLNQVLLEDVPAHTEVLGVRAFTYLLDPLADSNRLRRDDFTSREILDDAVDGLQFEYLLVDGSMSNQPSRAEDIRGVRISLLLRELKSDRKYTNKTVYAMGNRTYGPFRDNVRRILVSQLVEVKNHGLQ